MVKNHSGFSLIELLVVVGIIALLGAIGVVSYGSARQSARNAKRQADIEQIRSALEMYKADSATNVYPATNRLDQLVPTYLNLLPPPPPNTKVGGVAITTYDANGVYTRNTATTYTIRVDLEPSGTYTKTNP